MSLHFRPALSSETQLVASVLTAAAQQLMARNATLWAEREVNAEAIGAHVRAGRYHLAEDEAGAVGVFRLDPEDNYFWPEMPAGSAAYVHKVAVHPRAQGQGLAQQLLQHACTLARAQGVPHLRLDCMGGRPALQQVYLRFGFRQHSQVRIGNSLFERFEFTL